MRRALLAAVVVAAAGGSTLAFAANLNGVAATSLTVYSAPSTVPTSSCSSGATQDTWIDSAHKNTQHGTDAQLTVTAGGASWALVQFAPCAPANAAIVSASLDLYLASSPGGGRSYGAYPITSSWSETVTWRNAPSTGGQSASATPGGSGSTTSWSLASDVQAMVDGGANYGWAIEDNGGGTVSGSYDSREGGNPPALSLVYYP